jgi:hypothetical protein
MKPPQISKELLDISPEDELEPPEDDESPLDELTGGGGGGSSLMSLEQALIVNAMARATVAVNIV